MTARTMPEQAPSAPDLFLACDLAGHPLPSEFDAAGESLLVDRSADGGIGRASSADRSSFLLGRAIASENANLTAPIETVRACLDRHGAEIANHCHGEWIFIDWQPGCLRIAQSRQRRDHLFYARSGNVVVVSSRLERIAALGWIGRDFDPLGMAAAFGRGALRALLADRTVLPGVVRISPASCVTFDLAGICTEMAELTEAEPWHGTFGDAVEAARTAMASILAGWLDGANAPAVLLSGGLDSSTLAGLLTRQPGSRAALIAITSVSPPGSALPDEREEAALVARHLGLNHLLVAPDPAISPYRPHPDSYRHAGGPSLSPRHFLDRALARAARDAGTDILFDGSFGELTLSSYMPLASLKELARRFVRRARRRPEAAAGSPVHVRLAAHRMAELAAAELAVPNGPAPLASLRQTGQPWGWLPGHDKAWAAAGGIGHGVSVVSPFRDQRLLQLVAGFPSGFARHGGLDRALARAMMIGILPEAARLRRSVAPFSPDYLQRLTVHAGGALARLPAFRRVEADDWLDLDWLEQALQRIAARGPASIPEAYEAQLTAMAAEFIVWWRGDADA